MDQNSIRDALVQRLQTFGVACLYAPRRMGRGAVLYSAFSALKDADTWEHNIPLFQIPSLGLASLSRSLCGTSLQNLRDILKSARQPGPPLCVILQDGRWAENYRADQRDRRRALLREFTSAKTCAPGRGRLRVVVVVPVPRIYSTLDPENSVSAFFDPENDPLELGDLAPHEIRDLVGEEMIEKAPWISDPTKGTGGHRFLLDRARFHWKNRMCEGFSPAMFERQSFFGSYLESGFFREARELGAYFPTADGRPLRIGADQILGTGFHRSWVAKTLDKKSLPYPAHLGHWLLWSWGFYAHDPRLGDATSIDAWVPREALWSRLEALGGGRNQ